MHGFKPITLQSEMESTLLFMIGLTSCIHIGQNFKQFSVKIKKRLIHSKQAFNFLSDWVKTLLKALMF